MGGKKITDVELLDALAARLGGQSSAGSNFSGRLLLEDRIVDIEVRVRHRAVSVEYLKEALARLEAELWRVRVCGQENVTASRWSFKRARHCSTPPTCVVVTKGYQDRLEFQFMCSVHAAQRARAGGPALLCVMGLPKDTLRKLRNRDAREQEAADARMCVCGHRIGNHWAREERCDTCPKGACQKFEESPADLRYERGARSLAAGLGGFVVKDELAEARAKRNPRIKWVEY